MPACMAANSSNSDASSELVPSSVAYKVAACLRSPVDAAFGGVAYTDEGGGVNDGEIFEQDGVDQGENSSIGSYAEGEGQNGSHGEAAAVSELPEGIHDMS